MGSCEMHGHHLGQRIDVESILRSSISKRRGDRDRQLLEHGIENCKPRYELGMSRVAVVDFADRRLVNRATEVHLQNLGMAVVLPSSGRFSGSQADPARPNQLPVSWSALDL